MLVSASLLLGYQPGTGIAPRGVTRLAAPSASMVADLDALEPADVPRWIQILQDSPDIQLTPTQSAALLNAACEASIDETPPLPTGALSMFNLPGDAATETGPPTR